jgi:hypothetical protein
MSIKKILAGLSLVLLSPLALAQGIPDGSKDRPLRVMLSTADGGTETGTTSD